MKLYVDDRREAPEGWEFCSSITRAIYLLSMGAVNEISLDYDCGIKDESYSAIAYYIAVMPKELRPKTIRIHTDNPSGHSLMKHILKGVLK